MGNLSFCLVCPPTADKTEKPVSMNIKLRLAEEGEMEADSGPTLEFVLENDEVFFKEAGEDELRGKPQSEQQQSCTRESDRTGPCATDSAQIPDS